MTMTKTLALAAISTAALLAACNQKPAAPGPEAIPPVQPVTQLAPASGAANGALSPASVNAAPFAADTAAATDRTPAVLRAQVLLDRAKFSPGVIDGTPGENVRQAIAAYEEAKGLPIDGQLDQAVFDKLTQADTRAVLKTYVITQDDVKGPFVAIPHDMTEQSRMTRLGYQSAQELLAEKFHMSEDLLAQLNPGADLTKAGTTITVADVGDDTLPAQVGLIEVDKADKAVKAYDAKGNLLAFYPATIGSDDRPAPSGVLKVVSVAKDPTYTFDPARLTFKAKGAKTRTTIPAGPNNPVGAVWIGLSIPTFGIHGSDEPKDIGKKSSHGCVRLTNWDVTELASAAKAGIKVSFLDASAAGMRQTAAEADAKASGTPAKPATKAKPAS